MQTRKFPLFWRFAQAMFHGIVVNIITIFSKILFIPNGVFPKSSLPKISLLTLLP